MLEEKFNSKLKEALKAKDAIRASVIRMLKADITNTEIKMKKSKLADDDIMKIIKTHIKRHKDSIEQFSKADRKDLSDKEEKELAILNEYIPKQLSDEDLEVLVKKVIAEGGFTSKKEFGTVMKKVIEASKGTADGKRVSSLVSKMLTE